MILACPSCSARFKVSAEALGSGRNVKCAKCGHKWFATAEEDEEAGAAPAAEEVAPPPPPPPPEPPPAETPPPADADAEADADAAETDWEPATDTEPPDEPGPPPPPSLEAGDRPTYDEPPIGPDDDVVPRQRTPRAERRSPLGAWIVLAVLVLGVALGGFFFRHDIVKAYRPANAVFAAIGFPVDTLGFGLTIEQPQTQAIVGENDRRLVVKGAVRNTTDEAIEVPMLRAALRDAEGAELHVWTFRTDEARILPGETVTYETGVDDPPSGATGLHVTFTRPGETLGEGEAAAADADGDAGASDDTPDAAAAQDADDAGS